MNIFSIEYQKIKSAVTEQTLDKLTVEGAIGKNEERFWILNTNYNINSGGNREAEYVNSLLGNCKLRGYTSLLIQKEKPSKEEG